MQSRVFQEARLFLVFTAYWPSFQTGSALSRAPSSFSEFRRRLQSKSRAFEGSLGCALCEFSSLSAPYPQARLLHPFLPLPPVPCAISHKNLAYRETK